MASFESNLAPGETVIFRTRLHGLLIVTAILYAMMLGLLVDIIVFVIIFVAEAFGPKVGLFLNPLPIDFGQAQLYLLGLLPFALLGLIGGALNYFASRVLLTNQRIFITTGFLRRRSFEIDLNHPEHFLIHTPPSGRLFGFRRLVCFDPAAPSRIFAFSVVDPADNIQKVVAERSPRQSTPSPGLTVQPAPLGGAPTRRSTIFTEVEYPEEYTRRLLREASDHIKHDNPEAARRIVDRLVHSDPDNANVWYMAGYLASTRDQRKRAYQRALQINPNHKQARQGLDALE